MAELLVSPVLQVVLEKLSSPAIRLLQNRCNLKSNIKKLKRTVTMIQAALDDAEEELQATDTAIRIWLSDFKDAAYAAMYMLLDLSTQPPSDFDPFLAEVVKDRLSELEMATEKLLVYLTSTQKEGRRAVKREWDRRESSSNVVESEVRGRKEDKDIIVGQLLSCEAAELGANVSCITIEGMTGLGKTTLAQLAYNDRQVTRNFDVRAWVFVPDQLDVKKILVAVVESIRGDKNYNDSKMDALHSEVERLLHHKRYLIVLDDVWIEEQDDWDRLRPLFQGGVSGSKIVITTQSRKVAIMLDSPPFRHELKGLSEDDCWYLFRQRAFQRGEEEKYPTLWPIGRQIVRKCGGVALAAKSLGSLLRCKRKETEWLYVRDNELWNLDEKQSGILPALMLSYSRLPRHLKRCFAFCSIFPRGYEIKKEKLIQMWMAEGLIQSSQKKNILAEDIGEEYFEDLLWMSFFEEEQQSSDGVASGYKMNDVIYNLARFVAKSEYTILGHEYPAPESIAKIQHSSVVCDFNSPTIPEELFEAKGLLTLLLFSGGNLKKLPGNAYSRLKYLFVLNLSGCGLEVLEGSIAELRCLRYLDLSNTHIQRLPDQITELKHLETLNLFNCYNLESLPHYIGMKMENLRHLNNAGCRALASMGFLLSIGHCKLQTLPLFVVKPSDGIRTLAHLNLQGSLRITHLENVFGPDAKAARLITNRVESLGLYWGRGDLCTTINPEERSIQKKFRTSNWLSEPSSFLSSFLYRPHDPSIAEELLKNLHPHQNLKTLLIKEYPGIKFPRWDVPFLKVVHLIGCTSEHLPVLGDLQFLDSLLLQEMPGVKCITNEFYGQGAARPFPALKELVLIGFPNLEEWSSPDGVDAFPSLRKLVVSKCPQLIEMPVPVPVNSLELRYCRATIVHSFRELRSLETLVIEGIKDLFDFPRPFPGNNPLLTSLEIKSCSQLSELPPELVNLTALKSLTVRWCEELSYLPVDLQNLAALESLEISDCHKLERFPIIVSGGLSSLRSLSIENCSELTSLPRGLQYLTSLESLTIMYCPRIGTFSENTVEHLSALRRLSIISCEKLASLPDGLQNLNSLLSLEIRSCPALQALPDGIDNLVSLRSLVISGCENIISLPEGVKCLTTLQHLSIQDCPQLLEKCSQQSGEDWSKIAHVRHRQIGPPEQRHPSEAGSSSSA